MDQVAADETSAACDKRFHLISQKLQKLSIF